MTPVPSSSDDPLSPVQIKAHTKAYWDHEADHYDQYGAGPRNDSRDLAWRDWLIHQLGPAPLAVLDVGTGTGFLAMHLAAIGHQVTGVDQAPRMIGVARGKAAAQGHDGDLRIADAEELPFPDATFDAVVSRWVLWTLPGPERAATEWVRVLRPAGRLQAISSVARTDPDLRLAATRWLAYQVVTSVTERRNKLTWRWRNRDVKSAQPLARFDPPSVVANQAVFEVTDLHEVTVTFLDEVNKVAQDRPVRPSWTERLAFGPGGEGNDFYAVSGTRRS